MTLALEATLTRREVEPGEKPPSELYEVVEDADGGVSIRLNLHEGQARAWYSTERITAMVAGTQVGKTSFGPWWLWSRIVGVSVPDLDVYIPGLGPGDYLAVSPNYDLTKLKLIPELKSVFIETLKVGTWYASDRVLALREPPTLGHDDDGQPIYDYANWAAGEFTGESADDPGHFARIIVRSAKSSGGLESASAKLAWLDEAGQKDFTMASWEAVLRRLSLSRGPILITTTPYPGNFWLRDEVVEPGAAGDPDIRVIRVPSIVNPQFPQEEWDDRKRKMNPLRFAMMYEGRFVKMAGLVYPDFDDVNMTIPMDKYRIKIDPQTWDIVGGIDFGWNAPFAAVVLARSPDRNVYLLYSRAASETLLAEHADVLLGWERELSIAHGGGPNALRIAWYADPSGKSQIEELKNLGLYVESGMNDVIAGIDLVTEIVRLGRFRLYGAHHHAFVEEAGGYVWEQKNEQPTDKPVKRADHLMDAWRYAVAGLAHFVQPAGRGSRPAAGGSAEPRRGGMASQAGGAQERFRRGAGRSSMSGARDRFKRSRGR